MNLAQSVAETGVPPEVLLRRMTAELERRKAENRLASYAPYPKQREFHALGDTHRERLLRAGNQLGKTLAAGMEVAMHLTGRYPDWWKGRRFEKATTWWAGGVTAEATRDGAQRILLGRGGAIEGEELGKYGTGTIPAKCLHGSPLSRQGVADAVAIVKVRHKTGGISTLIFKSYDQGREKWQGDTIDGCWFDEEPPEDIYTEGLTRTNAGDGGKGGIAMLTFTPLLGMTNVVRRFIPAVSQDRADVVMTIEDVDHYSADQKRKIIESYPAHEREARTKGIPTLGSGRVFPVVEDLVRWEAIALPRYYKRIIGIDFGWDHPTAAAWLSWDPESDVLYVTDAYRVREQTPVIHAAAIKAKSKNQKIPVAWPHDGLQHDKGSGLQLAAQYRAQGLDMLSEHAKFVDGTNGVEAGVSEMLDRMQTGRLKVASHLSDWWEEFRLYHREDGRIVKEGDDLISATRYGLMCLRFAREIKPTTTNGNGYGQKRSESSWMTA
jgi:phage terminase large subunit-like protein